MRKFAPRRNNTYIKYERSQVHGITLKSLKEMRDGCKANNEPRYLFLDAIFADLEKGKEFSEIMAFYKSLIDIMAKTDLIENYPILEIR